MGYWNSRGLRGGSFEQLINMTNDLYLQKNLAVIQKLATPITPVKMDKDKRITLAYFEKKSTVDYMGVVQGIPVCFDAKETNQGRLPIQNIHPHQMEFMDGFETQGGVPFLLVHCQDIEQTYFLPFIVLKNYWNGAQNGGRKSIPYSAFEQKFRVYNQNGFPVHYLTALNTYLEEE